MGIEMRRNRLYILAAGLTAVLMTLHVVVMVTEAIKSSTTKEKEPFKFAPVVVIKSDTAEVGKFISDVGDSSRRDEKVKHSK